MTQITVTEADLGTVIATDSMLQGVTIESLLPSTMVQYRDYFTLVDDALGYERVIFNIDPSTSHVHANAVLFSSARIPFANLLLKNIPPGSSFLIDVEPPPPPPALDSLSPDTAVSGEADFVLSCIGVGFTADSVIVFGDYNEPTTFVSDTELTTIVKPSLFAPAVVPVMVRTNMVNTDPVPFTFTEPPVEPKRS